MSTLFATADHIAYLSTGDGTTEALNGRDGTVIWQHEGEPHALQVINGVVYLSTVSGHGDHVFALRERDGAVLWQYDLASPGLITTGDGMIFISANQTYALRRSDGELLWQAAPTGKLLEANGMLYLSASLDSETYNSFYALRTSDGAQVWHKSFMPTSPRESVQSYTMQLIDTTLYILPSYEAPSHLFALRANDGTQLWEHPLQVGLWRSSLIASQGIVYILSGSGLEALREADGSSVWSSPVQRPGPGLFITNDAIYVGTAGNNNTINPCWGPLTAKMEKLRLSDASQVWHIQFNPAPDPSLPVKTALLILGALLSLLGLLAFFVSRSQQTHDRLPQPLQEGTVLVVPVVSMPRIQRIGWLLLFLPGIVLLLVAAAIAAQWIQ